VTARALALLVVSACLAAPAFASDPADHPVPAAPVLVSDPGSGARVVIWSRAEDGIAKLAWARSDGSTWGPAHDLTFGPGLDVSPVVGISRTGTWLFWRGDNGQIFSAPIDLSRGHLLAVPRTLARGGRRAGSTSTSIGLTVGLGNGSIRPEGGSDVPIIVQACDPTNPVYPCVSVGDPGPGGTRDTPPVVSPEGGQDIPIIGVSGTNKGTGNTGTTGDTGSDGTTEDGARVGVSSSPDCDTQFVSLIEGKSILVIEFQGTGEIIRQVRLHAAKGIDPAEAAAAARDYFLKNVCH
jgi:hypothetical protein